MSFDPAGGNISGADDVALSNPQNNQLLSYDSTVQKWKNAGATVSVSVQTGNYTLALSDAGTVIEMQSSSARTLTVPNDSSVDFPVGTIIELVQTGSAQFTVTPGGSVTINSAGAALRPRVQW